MTPEEEERVRALLRAAAAEPARMPEDVADRLDAVLAGLADERSTVAPVADLAAARLRRRRWVQGLVAAAAVVAVVAGGGPVLRSVTDGGSSGSAQSTAASRAKAAPSQARGAAPATQVPEGGLVVLGVLREGAVAARRDAGSRRPPAAGGRCTNPTRADPGAPLRDTASGGGRLAVRRTAGRRAGDPGRVRPTERDPGGAGVRLCRRTTPARHDDGARPVTPER